MTESLQCPSVTRVQVRGVDETVTVDPLPLLYHSERFRREFKPNGVFVVNSKASVIQSFIVQEYSLNDDILHLAVDLEMPLVLNGFTALDMGQFIENHSDIEVLVALARVMEPEARNSFVTMCLESLANNGGKLQALELIKVIHFPTESNEPFEQLENFGLGALSERVLRVDPEIPGP
jgi:hypothetical protein